MGVDRVAIRPVKLAQCVGPNGQVVGLDCCEAFLDYGRKDVARQVDGHHHAV